MGGCIYCISISHKNWVQQLFVFSYFTVSEIVLIFQALLSNFSETHFLIKLDTETSPAKTCCVHIFITYPLIVIRTFNFLGKIKVRKLRIIVVFHIRNVSAEFAS